MAEENNGCEVLTELGIADLEKLIKAIDSDGDKHIVLKFFADWCAPCKRVKEICDAGFLGLSDKNCIKIIIDIDEGLDLYMFLKRKRMITGIPCSLAWQPQTERDYETWYIPDDSVLSSDTNDTLAFFTRQVGISRELSTK